MPDPVPAREAAPSPDERSGAASWVVRARQVEATPRLDDRSEVSPRFPGDDPGDLGGLTYQEVAERIRRANPDASSNKVSSWAEDMFAFVSRIAEGELLVIPVRNGDGVHAVLIARCSGAYSYEGPGVSAAHVRGVTWLGRFERDDLPPGVRNSLESPKAVFRIGDDAGLGDLVDQRDPLGSIHAALSAEGLRISRRTLRRYHRSLASRGFVILSGVSGTGKTWLAEAYARAVGAQRITVPVAPNWTSNEDLLGFFNPIDGDYVDTDFSRFLREAEAEWHTAQDEGRSAEPFHLVLDEMNLARVEYYFAKFLSVMEARVREDDASITLGPDDRVALTPNLSFIGTVNIDETTHGFADKVYDRAQLIEMPLDRGDLAAFAGTEPWALTLMQVWDDVHEVAPFAYRVIADIRDYVTASTVDGTGWRESLDEQILQKVLPKIRGDEAKVSGPLDRLLATLQDSPLSRDKAEHLRRTAVEHGFISYFEV